MAVDDRHLLARVPRGRGRALDLGGTMGTRRAALEARGYGYVNLDLKPAGERKVQGDAQHMPFADDSFDLIVCSDAFDSIPDLELGLREIRRVLAPGGSFIFWAPFMHQFGGDDLYRFTPHGLDVLLDRAGFGIVSVESPQWLFGLLAELPAAALRRRGVKWLAGWLGWFGDMGDRLFHRDPAKASALARAFVVTAKPGAPRKIIRPPRERAGSSRLKDQLLRELTPDHRGRALELDGTNARLPYEDGTFDLVVSRNGLGSYDDPFAAVREVRRVLAEGGTFVAWAPYLEPWRGRESVRFTPLGIALLTRWSGFRIATFDTRFRAFSVVARAVAYGLRFKQGGLPARLLENAGYALDRAARRLWGLGYAFAAGYAFVAVAEGGPRAADLQEARKVPIEVLWEELGDGRAAEIYREDRLAKEA